MPGDFMLDLDWPTCSLDNQKCPKYLARCDLGDKRRKLNEQMEELESEKCTER